MNEQLIERAQSLLAWMGEKEAHDHLVSEGINSGTAFLAVKAAQLAPTLPIKKAEVPRA